MSLTKEDYIALLEGKCQGSNHGKSFIVKIKKPKKSSEEILSKGNIAVPHNLNDEYNMKTKNKKRKISRREQLIPEDLLQQISRR